MRSNKWINHHVIQQCQYVQCGKDRRDGTFTARSPGWEAEAPRASGTVPRGGEALSVKADACASNDALGTIRTVSLVQEREMEVRRQALEDERRRREELEKRLQEETSRRQRLVETEMKLREKQRSQVFTKEALFTKMLEQSRVLPSTHPPPHSRDC